MALSLSIVNKNFFFFVPKQTLSILPVSEGRNKGGVTCGAIFLASELLLLVLCVGDGVSRWHVITHPGRYTTTDNQLREKRRRGRTTSTRVRPPV